MLPRILLGWAAVSLAACTTHMPLRTASSVPEGTWRVGGQVAVAPWCSFSRNLPERCADLPDGFPLPELRLQARRGISPASDVGASVQVATTLPPEGGFGGPGLRAGALFQWHQEVWSRPSTDGRQILAVAPGVGTAVTRVLPAGFAPDVDVVLPLYFGHQTAGWEWVGSLGVAQRFAFRPAEIDPADRFAPRTDVVLGAGALSRSPSRTAWWVGYHTPAHRPLDGQFSVAFGLLFDLTSR